jgi:hypothetical protein
LKKGSFPNGFLSAVTADKKLGQEFITLIKQAEQWG